MKKPKVFQFFVDNKYDLILKLSSISSYKMLINYTKFKKKL